VLQTKYQQGQEHHTYLLAQRYLPRSAK